MSQSLQCPLCYQFQANWLTSDRRRHYFHCTNCDLIFVNPEAHLSYNSEKYIYDGHNNDPADPQYRIFLNQLLDPLSGWLTKSMSGIDFGCGPTPTLDLMVKERIGCDMQRYDPYYFPNKDVLSQKYDFVTATEVVEHFNDPFLNWEQLTSLLKPLGYLAIMTYCHTAEMRNQFKQWGYKADPSHVCFYSIETFNWLAEHFNLSPIFYQDRVTVFQMQP